MTHSFSPPHGGNRHLLAQEAGVSPDKILDFSVNVHPAGPSLDVQGALLQAMDSITHYPSPYAEEACAKAAHYYNISVPSILFGNGSNQLIHAIPTAFSLKSALILHPAFSEYEKACHQAGMSVHYQYTLPENKFQPHWESLITQAQKVDIVFVASPSNPAGVLLDPQCLQEAIRATPNTYWLVDEAFIEFSDESQSLITLSTNLPNLLILRSLTKFHGMAGIRTGFIVAQPKLIALLKNHIPAWSLGSFSIAAACAIFSQSPKHNTKVREETRHLRKELEEHLHSLPDITPYPSEANYILFSWKKAPADFAKHLLISHHIALRDCANYPSLEKGGWYRVAVRTQENNQRLLSALRDYTKKEKIFPQIPALLSSRKKPALMLQGTCSDAGKSILTAALCRILHQDGFDVAPFKAQNMALNSGVTANGEEMGRAQLVQASAAKLAPDVRMNPVLLKPHSDTGSQVVVLGHPRQCMTAREYFSAKRQLWTTVRDAYDSLSAEHEVMVLEGAGSPGEINLKQADIVNMRMATHAQASVLLTGDIDRGGIYASLLGTWMTFTRAEKNLVSGFLINKFRGDATLLKDAHTYIHALTGIPVRGVIPMIKNLRIPEEDRPIFSFEKQQYDTHSSSLPPLDIAVILLGHVSNYTDFAPLAAEPDVILRPVRQAHEWGNPHLIIIPGSKNVVGDLCILQEKGLDALILKHAQEDKCILGICGGLQILGKSILDPHGVETQHLHYPGLSLLNITTTLQAQKTLLQLHSAQTPLGIPTSGYEIHHGTTTHEPDVTPLFLRPDNSFCGYGKGNIWGTYLHGHLDNDAYRRCYLDHVRKLNGLVPAGKILARYDLDEALDDLAHIVRENVNIQALYQSIGIA